MRVRHPEHRLRARQHEITKLVSLRSYRRVPLTVNDRWLLTPTTRRIVFHPLVPPPLPREYPFSLEEFELYLRSVLVERMLEVLALVQ